MEAEKELVLKLAEPAREWTVYQCDKFAVTVRAWPRSGEEWTWNMYAMIYDTHPLHQNVEGALSLPFHGGVTYEQRIVSTPAQGLRYDWQRVSDLLKIGCDYAHYGDEWAQECSPADGIPFRIQRDALELVEELTARGVA